MLQTNLPVKSTITLDSDRRHIGINGVLFYCGSSHEVEVTDNNSPELLL
jgi:hypothetical protein